LTQVNFCQRALSMSLSTGGAEDAAQQAVLHDVKERFTIRDNLIAALRYRGAQQGITFLPGAASGVQAGIIHSTIL